MPESWYLSVMALDGAGLKLTTRFVVPEASPTLDVPAAKLAIGVPPPPSSSLIVRVCTAFVVPTL